MFILFKDYTFIYIKSKIFIRHVDILNILK
jgi:hypothetical protein